MKIKTSELTGAALDWAVAKCEGFLPADMTRGVGYFRPKDPNKAKYFTREYNDSGSTGFAQAMYEPSSNWAQGGPIIEREGVTSSKTVHGFWEAYKRPHSEQECYQIGPTPLIAAMRCYVASKMGDEVDVPEELSC